MKYKVKTVRGKRPMVVVKFEDDRFDLIGEMLLAERPFLRQMIQMLERVCSGGAEDSFSGNAFTLSATSGVTTVTNDVNEQEAQAPTAALLKLCKAYQKQYEHISR